VFAACNLAPVSHSQAASPESRACFEETEIIDGFTYRLSAYIGGYRFFRPTLSSQATMEQLESALSCHPNVTQISHPAN
jgi:hypothetical protein